MDNYRLLLILALLFLGMMLWSAWQQDYHGEAPLAQATTSADVAKPSDVPDAKIEPGADRPMERLASSSQGQTSSQSVQVVTDVLSLTLDTAGGVIKQLDLLAYPMSPEHKDTPFRLLSESSQNYFTAQSGLLGDSEGLLPTHKSLYQVEQQEYRLADGADLLEVKMTWANQGISVDKIYRFRRGSYQIELIHRVNNQGTTPIVARDYRQFLRSKPSDGQESFFIYTYTGGAIYSPQEKFSKISFDDLDSKRLAQDVSGGWIAMMQHYFLGAFIPDAQQPYHFYSKKLAENRYILGLYSQSRSIEPGQSESFDGQLWLGPKLQELLEQAAAGLELTTDYGFLTVIAKPLFWILNAIHDWVGNWGWAIVILTILIKLAFYKLSAASYKSMAGMRKLTPKLQQIKERYGEDKEKFNKAMMELYQKEKINPVGGCLPILVQIPVFIALYWVLLESVELRDAPFILWIDNLSVKDPYFILPLIMGVSMYVQQKLNPQPPDPLQAKIMMSLPFIFTIFFAFFPSGLVLYWVVNNLLSILQQWHITRKFDEEKAH